MRIGVVVPSSEYLVQAGVRIRYERLRGPLEAAGHQLDLIPIDTLTRPPDLTAEVYLFSKCYDARAAILARAMHAAGALTGADFFDDMFSEVEDARFAGHRSWLRSISPSLQFGLSSTERMRDVIATSGAKFPIHIVHDPLGHLDPDHLAHRLAAKRRLAIADRRIRVAWFGTGDNPHFTVGLPDLVGYAESLLPLGRRGFTVDLRVLTNRRALTADGLRLLSRLPIPFTLGEWSEAEEVGLIETSLVTFLPVAEQGFSTAKSLNRAVSALTGGSQILSAGHELYRPLRDLLYRDGSALVEDLEQDRLRLRPETVALLGDHMHRWGDPIIEAQRLAAFLSTLPAASRATSPPLAVIHGRKSSAPIHKQAQRLGALSVGTPVAHPSLHYDIAVRAEPDVAAIELTLGPKAHKIVAAELAAQSFADDLAGELPTTLLAVDAEVAERIADGQPRSQSRAVPDYAPMMSDITALIDGIIPGSQSVASESEAALAAIAAVRPGRPALAMRPIERRGVERILFVANGQIPSLNISFLKPLAKPVAEGRLRTLTITDTDLTKLFGRSARSKVTRAWVRKRVAAFDPTLIVCCRYSGPLAQTYCDHARDRNVPIVFHLDDDLFDLPPELGAEKIHYHTQPERVAAVDLLIEAASLVYASTRPLYDRLASRVPAERLAFGKIYCAATPRRLPLGGPARKFGYMGGGDHAHDLDRVAPAIAALMERFPDVRFEIFGSLPVPAALAPFGTRVSVVPPIADYGAFLAHFSSMDWNVGLCPLIPSSFNACKANTKWVEYTAVGIGVVATQGLAYDECCADGAGLLAVSHDDWLGALTRLVTEDGLARDLTLTAQRKLDAEYAPEALRRQIAELVEPLLQRPLYGPRQTNTVQEAAHA